MMKSLSRNHIAWLIPAAIFIHQLEEYFGGFPLWYSNLLNADLSNQDFIFINGIGLFLITLLALSTIFNKNNLILVALGTLEFVNGLTHLMLSLLTVSYSPGTISGVFLFLPMGAIIYRKIFPQMARNERVLAVSIGVVALFSVSIIARNL